MLRKSVGVLLLVIVSFSDGAYAQKTPKIDFLKKIEDATPSPLPQGPVPSRVGRDARDKGLKGRVRTIVESMDAPGEFKGISDEYLFGADGNYLRTVSYKNGFPNEVTVWGYLNGSRVSKGKEVQYSAGEKPKSAGIELIQESGGREDGLFDLRFTFAYDPLGRIVEESSFNNEGALWDRLIYGYTGSQRDKRDHDGDGNEINRTEETLDKDGNILEEREYGADGKVSTTRFHTYEFDSHGNWTVQKTFEAKGRTGRKLLWTTFRTVTYYP
jgi:hypothetical protein